MHQSQIVAFRVSKERKRKEQNVNLGKIPKVHTFAHRQEGNAVLQLNDLSSPLVVTDGSRQCYQALS